ncbi:MAG: hypothetical protein EOS78_09610 [Mesorhizobium sp.]|nr:MAG: hypothetical protein EOS78_09610 [Mesorhizobium sp.]
MFLRNSGRKTATHFSWNCSSKGNKKLRALRPGVFCAVSVSGVDWRSFPKPLPRMVLCFSARRLRHHRGRPAS